jgi:ABC-type transport system substrate-binding protein
VVARPRVLESASAIAAMRSRDYEAAFWVEQAWAFANARALAVHCRGRDVANVHAGVCDDELDRLADTLESIVDPVAALPHWSAYQRRLAELQTWTVLFYPHQMIGVSNRLRNVRPDVRGPFTGARKWWLLPE